MNPFEDTFAFKFNQLKKLILKIFINSSLGKGCQKL